MSFELFGKTGLSLERLQTLCEVAEKGSIGQATKGDTNRQTQFSRQISELEKFFGVDLLDRTSRPHRLSEQGQELARLSRDYLMGLADFQSRCLKKPVKLVIGAGESMIQWILMPMLDHLAREIPEATISMRNLRTKEIIQALHDGEVDLGLVQRSAVAKPLKTVGEWSYGYRLFVPKTIKLKHTGKLTISHLIGLPLVALEGDGNFRRQLADLARAEGVDVTVRLECSSYSQIATAVQSGSYCGFLPQFAARHLPAPQFQQLEVAGFESLKRELVFAWCPKKGDLRPVVEKAIKLFRNPQR